MDFMGPLASIRMTIGSLPLSKFSKYPIKRRRRRSRRKRRNENRIDTDHSSSYIFFPAGERLRKTINVLLITTELRYGISFFD